MIGIILAAGDGSRYKKSSGKDICKILNTVNGNYLLEFALNNLKSLGVKKAFIVVGSHSKEIKNEIGSSYLGLAVNYIHQPVRKGLINAFIQALNVANGDDVILQLADEIFINFKADKILHTISDNNFDFLCGITYEANAEKIKNNYSVCVDNNSVLKGCTEKPYTVVNNIKGTGFCIFKKHCLELLCSIYDEKSNTPCDLCDFMNYLISKEQKGLCVCVADKEFNINEHSDLLEATNYYSAQADKNDNP